MSGLWINEKHRARQKCDGSNSFEVSMEHRGRTSQPLQWLTVCLVDRAGCAPRVRLPLPVEEELQQELKPYGEKWKVVRGRDVSQDQERELKERVQTVSIV